jgi:hypothetical protein
VSAETAFIRRYLIPEGLQLVKPEDVGEPAGALIVKGNFQYGWSFRDHQLTSFLEELIAGNAVVWQRGKFEIVYKFCPPTK